MKVKGILLVFMIGFSCQAFPQQISGLVLDSITKMPLVRAKITSASSTTLTSSTGRFHLSNVSLPDTLIIQHPEYKSYSMPLHENTMWDSLVILMQHKTILLQEVMVMGKGNPTLDSIKNRKDFKKVFSHKKPTFMDSFISGSPTPNGRYTPFQNATSSVASINLLSVVALFSRNKSPLAKLQKRMLEQETFNFVDQTFSKALISAITPLKDDSLQQFINLYRPSLEDAKSMDDYELILYIKKNYETFKNTPQPEEIPSLYP